MSEPNFFINNLRKSPGIRLCVLFFSFFVLLLIASLLIQGIDSLYNSNPRNQQLWNSVVQSILVFCIPALLVAKFCDDQSLKWLELRKSISVKAIAGIIIVYLISLPAMEWLISWNESIQFPESMSELEKTLRQWEETSAGVSETLLSAHGFWQIVTGVLVIGLLTGLSEELFFRGAMQKIFIESSINKTIAVWLAAFIFSTLHFQFFGFFPRLLMGAFFGFLLLWTHNLWVAVFAHALNNSMVVILSGMDLADSTTKSLQSMVPAEYILPAASVILTFIFFLYFKDFFFRPQNKKRISWLKNRLYLFRR